MREGLEKIWEVCMCLSLYDMTICDSVWWSEIHMSCQYSIGHLSSKLFKIQTSRLMSFGWQIGWQNVCVIDTESKWEHRNFVKGVLWYRWCLLHVDCRDFPVWHDTVRLTRWLSQGKSVKTSLSGALCYKTDVVKVHVWHTRVLPWTGWQVQPTKSSLPGSTHSQVPWSNLCEWCKVCYNTSSKKKSTKTTAPRIPAWSPTVVLTRRHPG